MAIESPDKTPSGPVVPDGEWRDTVVNWENQLQRVIDDYGPFAGIAHAVQKDAIQNSWDGRTHRKKGNGWSCVLELHRDSAGHRFMTITDAGTTGLTGRVLSADEYLTYMSEDEKWARFESHAFTHEGDSSDYLGARGQGKFIFVGASQTRTIYYDTLRADGVYRLGARRVMKTSSPIVAWEGEDAAAQLKEFSEALTPLTEVGTRVIIDDPVPDVIDAFEDGSLVTFVADTWWPIITKFGAAITVAASDSGSRSEVLVEVPEDLLLPSEDDGDHRVWRKERQRLDFGGERFTIKRAHFVYDTKGPVRPELAGIALVRGGMVVTRLPMAHVPAMVAASTTGYVEFADQLDVEMKRAEHPTHYTFDLRRGVALKVKRWIEDELNRFAAEQLGVGGDKKGVIEKARRDAEKNALQALNQAARDLGLVGKSGPSGGGSGGGKGGSTSHLKIAVQLDQPEMPTTDSRRVEYDETISNIRARVQNNTGSESGVRVSVYLTMGDTLLQVLVDDEEVTVHPHSASEYTLPAELTLSADDWVAGLYVLRARVVVASSSELPKMHEHKTAFRFWLAEDPPQLGLFSDVVAFEFAGEYARIDGEAQPGSSGGWDFQYNLAHPAYLRVEEDIGELTEYLFEMMVREMVYVDLRSEPPVLFDDDDLADHSSQQRKAAQVIGSVLYDYYGS